MADPLVATTVKEFLDDCYQLVSASSPTAPLRSNNTSKGLKYLNRLIAMYSGNGLMVTVAKQVNFPVTDGEGFITFASPTFLPPATYQGGRLVNLQTAWVVLGGVTYPLTVQNRSVFQSSYKYFPQRGVPLFILVYYENNETKCQLYPAPSQEYEFFGYGKFALPTLNMNSDMSEFPDYFLMFLQFVTGKYLGFTQGRASAWDEKLETTLVKLESDVIANSSMNLTINSDNANFLNGAARVRAGI